MDFGLFIVLNGLLLIRPEDLMPDISGLRLYLITIVCCILSALPKLTANLSSHALTHQPVSVCVIGSWVAAFLSFVVAGLRLDDGFDFAGEFGKVVLYYLLLVSIIDTKERFRALVAWLILFTVFLTTLAVAQINGYVSIPSIEPVTQRDENPETGEIIEFSRLVSCGIFNDPNDLCLILVLGMIGCFYRSVTAESGSARLFWLLPIVGFFYALMLTHSRGGLLGLFGAGAGYFYSRYGLKRGVPLLTVGILAVLIGIGGRQANIGGGGTAHERLMFWAQALTELFNRPLMIFTGLTPGFIALDSGSVAHNSFVQGYVETGLLGGGLFAGAFFWAGRLVDRGGRPPAPEWVVSARPFVFALVLGYAVGCYSLTRNYVLPTYLVLGLAQAMITMATPTLPEGQQVTAAWWKRMALLSVAGLVAIKYMTQTLGQLGV